MPSIGDVPLVHQYSPVRTIRLMCECPRFRRSGVPFMMDGGKELLQSGPAVGAILGEGFCLQLRSRRRSMIFAAAGWCRRIRYRVRPGKAAPSHGTPKPCVRGSGEAKGDETSHVGEIGISREDT